MTTTTNLDEAHAILMREIAIIDTRIEADQNTRARLSELAHGINVLIHPSVAAAPVEKVTTVVIGQAKAPVKKSASPKSGHSCPWCGVSRPTGQALGQHKRYCTKRPGFVMPSRTDAQDMATIDRPAVEPDPDPMVEVFQCESCDWHIERSAMGAFISMAHHTEREHGRAAEVHERTPILVPKVTA